MQNDYIMRLMERLAQVLAQALGLRSRGLQEEATVVLEQAMKSILGLDADLVDRLSADALAALLRTSEGSDLERTALLADCLNERALAMPEWRAAEAAEMHHKALSLYAELGPLAAAGAEIPRDLLRERASTIGDLAKPNQAWGGYQCLTWVSLAKLLVACEAAGLYGRCDDIAFEFVRLGDDDLAPGALAVLEACASKPPRAPHRPLAGTQPVSQGAFGAAKPVDSPHDEAVAWIEAMYERFSHVSSDDLVKGGLPPEEVRESLASVSAMRRTS